MTFLDMLGAAERQNHSMLCVGLDPEPTRFPGKLKGDANKIYDFCAAIVDATADWWSPSSRKLPTSPRTAPRASSSA